MEKIALDIYEKVIKDIPTDSVLVFDSGHFDSVLGVDEFSLGTAGLVKRLFELSDSKRRKGLKIVFAVLLDDVGMSCDEDAMICMPKDTQKVSRTEVPEELRMIFEQTIGFKKERLRLFSEKTARNRGIQFFRKNIESLLEDSKFSLTIGEDGRQHLYFRTAQEHDILMADLTSDVIWTGHCPLLMAMHYRDVSTWVHKLFSTYNKIAIIDFSLTQDRGKVNGGAQIAVAASTGASRLYSITNVCFADDDLDIYTLDEYGAPE